MIKETLVRKYVISKSSRTPGNVSYTGPALDKLQIRHLRMERYTDKEYAEALAKLLRFGNPIGFVVTEVGEQPMIHYKDKTFCIQSDDCDQSKCHRYLSTDDEQRAKETGLPIAYSNFDGCKHWNFDGKELKR